MARCLLGLGSNLGDREATLNAALAAIDALPDVQLRKKSEWLHTRPIGGPAGQGEFPNGAVLIDTTIAPLILLKELQQIEERLGRKPAERWAPRPIDIDMLLYDREVMEQEMITLPHPRLTFRRFVLQPAAEVAPKMIHPVIGWPIRATAASSRPCERRGGDCIAIGNTPPRADRMLSDVSRATERIAGTRHRGSTLANRLDDLDCNKFAERQHTFCNSSRRFTLRGGHVSQADDSPRRRPRDTTKCANKVDADRPSTRPRPNAPLDHRRLGRNANRGLRRHRINLA